MSDYFDRANAEIMLQKMSYQICEMCDVDPLACSYRFGNRHKCNRLADQIDKIFDESAKMHGE
jgi:hypothetical protein